MDLAINNREAILSGAVLIPAGVAAAIKIPGGMLNLRFETVGDPGYKWENLTLTITSPENPLGIGLFIPVPLSDGGAIMNLSMTIHTVGDGERAQRLVHYTGYYAE